MKKLIKIALLIFIIFCFFNTVYADTTVHLNIKTNTGSVYDKDIDVTPCDSEGTGIMETTAYCALSQSGIASDWSGPYGPLWINSINGVLNNDNNNGVYWMWLVNLNTSNPYSDFNCHQDAPYSCSAKQYILNPNDNILFYYNIDPLSIVTPPTTPDPIITPTSTEIHNPSGGGQLLPPVTPILQTKITFDIKKALEFLISQQKENGSFGEDLYTDWSALALASQNYQNQIIKLIKYFGEIKMENPSLTDYERHAMAQMALGLNPYNFNGENYIEKIITSFDGKQFGDVNEDNDDIFALIVLQNAGYKQDEKIINDDINFILSKQKENGSWDGSVDMTGAGMEALSIFRDPLPTSPLAEGEAISNALVKAKNFLKQNQKDNGGWNDNASSTAWAIEGILALNEKPEDWKKDDPAKDGTSNTPFDYLATLQDADGGIKDDNLQNKIWKTAYVTSIMSGKTWNQIMQKFEKPKILNLTKNTSVKNPPVTKKNLTKSEKVKLKNIAKQEVATAINAINPLPDKKETETPTPPQKNWFMRLLSNVFRF